MSIARLAGVLVMVAPAGGALYPTAAQNAVPQDSLSLERAIALAQDQGLKSQGARSARDAARYRDRAFEASYLPQLSLSGTLPQYNRTIIPVLQPDGTTRFRPQNQSDMGLTATMNQRLPTGGNLFVSSGLSTYSVSAGESVRSWSSTPVLFGVNQTLFKPNVSAFERRAQPIRTELAERQYREAREDVALETTNLYFDLYAARVAFTNASSNATINDTLYTLNKGRYEVGKIGQDELLQSELALLRARAARDAARLDYDRAREALRIALDLPSSASIDITVPPMIPDYMADTSRAVAEGLRNRAGATQTALQKVEAERSIADAKANNGFSATVQASVGFNATAPEFGAVYRDLLEARQVNVGVQLPLLQWGAGKAAVQAAEADRAQALSTGRATEKQLAFEARFAALTMEQSRTNVALAAKADTVAARRFEVAYNRYLVGRIAVDNLYLAQSEKDQAVTGYLQALRSAWVAHYQLRRATLFDFARKEPIS